MGLAILVWITSRHFPTLPEGYPGPALFPRVVAVLLLLAGLGLVIGGVKAAAGESQSARIRPLALRLSGGLGAVALFLLALPAVGTGPAAGVACLLIAATLRVRWKQAVAAALLTGFAVHLMFSNLLGL